MDRSTLYPLAMRVDSCVQLHEETAGTRGPASERRALCTEWLKYYFTEGKKKMVCKASGGGGAEEKPHHNLEP